MAEKYNGWSNYETWCVNLWLTNDQATLEYCDILMRQALDDAPKSQRVQEWGCTVREAACAQLAEGLKEMLEGADLLTDLLTNPSVYSDLLTAALGQVDWHEIAANFLGEDESA